MTKRNKRQLSVGERIKRAAQRLRKRPHRGAMAPDTSVASADWFCEACRCCPHAMDCPELALISGLERAGICAQCRATKPRTLFWDEKMGAVVEMVHCPNGHSSSMSWLWPEDVSQADRDMLGLVAVKQ